MVCCLRLLVSYERIYKRTNWPHSLSIRFEEGMFQQQGLLVLANLWCILSPSYFVLLLLLAWIGSFQLLGFWTDSSWRCSNGRQSYDHCTHEQVSSDWHHSAPSQHSRLLFDLLPNEPQILLEWLSLWYLRSWDDNTSDLLRFVPGRGNFVRDRKHFHNHRND